MRHTILSVFVVLGLAGCATPHHPSAAAAKRSIDAVVVDESQRQKVLRAIDAGASPDQALARVSDGPKNEKPVPN